MWKQISKFNYNIYINFAVDNFSIYSHLVYKSDYKSEYEYTVFCEVDSSLNPVEIPIFRRVEYSSGRSTYFCNKPFILWFKYYH